MICRGGFYPDLGHKPINSQNPPHPREGLVGIGGYGLTCPYSNQNSDRLIKNQIILDYDYGSVISS
ncbi:hypothetical protein PMG71_00245 [Roseofilum sp. BLCC_M154]|uniref:Uncharacterized protein n=1 Tax=Roseofilum acuticapitatum BLCC-M154 TaxID=3022444 RepID=A0ABT7ALU2_9CYAN|nr:hypothetical protein [Roseofilum acuticapitatum]MDJ1167850.1 hypothetical protein [Roseofilum acuticapitatum BLCC-M154]